MMRGCLMPSFWTDGTGFPYSNDVYPALTSLTDEVCATVARIFAYVGTLALFGIVGIHLWSQYQAEAGTAAKMGSEAGSKTGSEAGWTMGGTGGWKVSDRSRPAFAVGQFDASDKSAAYTILRHPDGGRKDVLRWTDVAEKPVAELEIYRPGRESNASSPAAAEIAARMLQIDASAFEAAGIIESKLGTVALLRPVVRSEATGGAEACLAFFKRIDEPHLQIAGWSCQGDNGPARRAAIGCMLSRLTLLTSGNEPKLAGLFARAELKRGNCAATPADWVTGVENPKLRGTL
jgi:hypothetical protein